MKQSKKIWGLIIIGGILMTSLSIYAINSYRSDPGTSIVITDSYLMDAGECKSTVNNSGAKSYFLPTKTKLEYDRFKTAAPSLDRVSVASGACANCIGPDGTTILHGAGKTYYKSSSVSCVSSCQSETRTCDNGALSGSYTNASCSVPACTYSWKTGNWSKCSVSCGGGTQTRSVWCERSDGTTVADSNCTGTKPATSQSCNKQSCSAGTTWIQTGYFSACYTTINTCPAGFYPGGSCSTAGATCQKTDGTCSSYSGQNFKCQ